MKNLLAATVITISCSLAYGVCEDRWATDLDNATCLSSEVGQTCSVEGSDVPVYCNHGAGYNCMLVLDSPNYVQNLYTFTGTCMGHVNPDSPIVIYYCDN